MPQAAFAIAAWLATTFTSTTLAGLSLAAVKTLLAVGYLIVGAGIAAAAYGANLLLGSLAPKFPGIAQRAQSQTLAVREPVSPHKQVFGTIRYAGTVTWMESVPDAGGEHPEAVLNMLMTQVSHSCGGNVVVYADDYPILIDHFIPDPSETFFVANGGDGIVMQGRYRHRTDPLPTFTISGGTITPAAIRNARVDTEAAASSDNLDAISAPIAPPVPGQSWILTLQIVSNSRTVTIRHGVSNIITASGADVTLSTTNDRFSCEWNFSENRWEQVETGTLGGYDWKLIIDKNNGGVGQLNVFSQKYKILELLSPRWRTGNHIQLGHAGIHYSLIADNDVYASLPNFSGWFVGHDEIYDPRTDAKSYTQNPALCALHYLTLSKRDGGGGARYSPTATFWDNPRGEEEIDEDSFVAFANLCEEYVALDIIPQDSGGGALRTLLNENVTKYPKVNTIWNTIEFDFPREGAVEIHTGDKVTVSMPFGGTFPGDLEAGDYYVAVINPWAFKVEPHEYVTADGEMADDNDTPHFGMQLRFYTDPEDALRASPKRGNNTDFYPSRVALGSEGEGWLSVVPVARPRYQINYLADLSRPREDILNEIGQACGGQIVNQGGKWYMTGGQYVAPTVSFDEGNLLSPVNLQTIPAFQDRFTEAEGSIMSPLAFGTATQYRSVVSQQAEASENYYLQDQSEASTVAQIDYAAVTSYNQAMRLSAIQLARTLNAKTFSADFDMTMLQLIIGDTFEFTFAAFGWTSKVFEILDMEEGIREDDNGMPIFYVNVLAKETGAAEWEPNVLAVAVQPFPGTTPRDPFYVDPPANFAVTPSLYSPTPMGAFLRASCTWDDGGDATHERYQLQYKKSVDADWTSASSGLFDTVATVDDLEVALYDFRVRAYNHFGRASAWNTLQNIGILPDEDVENVTGLSATIQRGGSGFIFSWDAATQPQVYNGGRVLIRHDDDAVSGAWIESIVIGPLDGLEGNATHVMLPYKSGTYLFKFQDFTGKTSPTAASFSVPGNVDYGTAHSGGEIVEDPTFAGTKTDCEIDTATDPDTLIISDTAGVVETVALYEFDNVMDLATVKAVSALVPTISVVVFDTTTEVCQRTGNVCDWDVFCGIEAIGANAYIEVRTTDDDPAGAATWSSWWRLDGATGGLSFRGLEARLQMRSFTEHVNIRIGDLAVRAYQ